jgi:hypothetical protein
MRRNPGWGRPTLLVAVWLGLVSVAGAQQAESPSYQLSEWTLAAGGSETPSGPSLQISAVINDATGQEARSTNGAAPLRQNYIVSTNFLTDDFGVRLSAPENPYYSIHFDSESIELRWEASAEELIGGITGYLVQFFDALGVPSSLPEQTFVGSVVTIEGIEPGVEHYASIRPFFGEVDGPETRVFGPRAPLIRFVTTTNQPEGDVNGDGVTDGTDFVEALFAFNREGQTGHNAAADLVPPGDPDGVVDMNDLDEIRQNMGWQGSK